MRGLYMCSCDVVENDTKLRKSIIEDNNSSFFVEAGAGAGKTGLIVDRITNQIVNGIKPERIAAITFTNKASQELRERISNNVKNVLDGKDKATLRDAYNNISRMQISTIHSFCNRILKEHCFEANMRLDVELLEQDETTKLQAELFDKWISNNSDKFQRLKESFPDSVNFNFKTVRDAFLNICDLPLTTEFCSDNLSLLGAKSYAEYIKNIEDKIQDLENDKATLAKKYKTTLVNEINVANGTEYEEYEDIPKDIFYADIKNAKDDSALYKALTKTDKIIKKINNKEIILENLLNTIIDDIDAIKAKEQSGEYERLSSDEKTKIGKVFAYSLILEFVLEIRKEYRNSFLLNHYISQDLLLQKTNEVLDVEKVRNKVRGMFDCIYVDEFQDTDPIQRELIMKICCDESSNIIPGKVFIVGDVKQSIYRFRNADYRLFYDTRDKYFSDETGNAKSGCRIESLSINRRSNQEIIDFVNEKAKTVFDDKSGILYSDMEYYPVSDWDKEASHGIYGVTTDGIDEYNDPKEVIQVINTLVGKHKINRCENREWSVGPIEYKDFLILTLTKKEAKDYVDELRESGIPARIAVEFSPGEVLELKRFAALYEFIAFPHYKKAQEKALQITQGQTSSEISWTEDSNLSRLTEYFKEAKSLSGAEVLGLLLREEEKYLFSLDALDSHTIKNRQMAVRQMVETVLSRCDNNPSAICIGLNEYINAANKLEREYIFDKNENSVRIMNIHKAKGLEGNIVIIAQRKSHNEGNSNYSTLDGKRYQIFKNGPSFLLPYELDSSIQELALVENERETQRLEYVGVTRAREMLIFMGSLTEKSAFSSYAAGVKDFYEAYEKIELDKSIILEAGEHLDSVPLPNDKQTVTSKNSVTPSSLEKTGKPVIQGKIIEEETKTEGEESDANEEKELLAGNVRGTIIHRAFELAINQMRLVGTVDADLCINRAVSENNDDLYKYISVDTEKAIEQLVRRLKDAIFPDFINVFSKKIASAKEVYTEYPFSITLKDSDISSLKTKLDLNEKTEKIFVSDIDNTLWCNGKADLIIINQNDEVEIWDYKSDKKDPSISAEDFKNNILTKYNNQMNFYKWVFERLLEKPTKGFFYSIEVGEISQ